MADMLLKLQINNEDIAYYPDLMVDYDNQEKRFIKHPTVIIEVPSKSTAKITSPINLLPNNYLKIFGE